MPEEDTEPPVSRLRSFAELVRLPNLFTAAADVLMGFFFVQAENFPAEKLWMGNIEKMLTPLGKWVLGLLVAASCLLYAAGVVLNDVFDLAHDRDERPDRPLPSGRISLRAARWLGLEFLLFGTFIGCAVGIFLRMPRPAAVAVLLAAAIVLYDTLLRRTLLGPINMGACRMLNVLLGMSVLGGPWRPVHWIVAGGIGLYVVGITWFARKEALRSNRVELTAAMLVMLAGVAMLGSLPYWTGANFPEPNQWYLATGLLGLIIAGRCVWAIGVPVPGRVRQVVTQSILTLVFLDAVAAYYAAKAMYWPIVILILILPALLLTRWFEST